MRKHPLYRPDYGRPVAGFGVDLDEGVVIVRNPDGTIERTPIDKGEDDG